MNAGQRFLARLQDQRWRVVKAYESSDCAPAALATLALFYGNDVGVAKVRSLMRTSLQGTSIHEIEEAAPALGFDVNYSFSRERDLQSIQSPSIALCQGSRGSHFVVVFAVRQGEVVVGDPSHGVILMKPFAFREVWTGHRLAIFPNVSMRRSRARLAGYWQVLLSAHSRSLCWAILMSTFATAASLGLSLSAKRVIDAEGQNSRGMLLSAIALSFCVTATKAYFQYLRQVAVAAVGTATERDLAERLITRIFRLQLRFVANRTVGDILSRVADISTVRATLCGAGLVIAIDLTTLTVGVMWLAWLSPMVALVVLAGSIAVVAAGVVVRRRLRECQQVVRDAAAKVLGRLHEAFLSIRIIKSSRAEGREIRRALHGYSAALDAQLLSARITAVTQSVSGAVSSLSVILVIVLVAMTRREYLSAGDIVFFYSAALLIIGASEHLATLVAQTEDGNVALERLHSILDESLEIEPDDTAAGMFSIVTPERVIECDAISFAYHGVPVLAELDLVVRTGERLAIKGPSGVGKSTVAALMAGLYSPQSGEIRFFGSAISQVELRRHAAIAFQDAMLMSGSVIDNIRLGDEQLSDALLTEIVEVCCLEFVESLPNGFQYQVGHVGSALSSGQRQRVALARALAKRPRLLILDEATSHLDEDTEQRVMRNILKMTQAPAGIVIISHRASVWSLADRVLQLDLTVESGDRKFSRKPFVEGVS